VQTEYRNINQGGRARRPARHAANVRVPPQSGGQRAARVRQPGPYGYPAVPGPRTVRGGAGGQAPPGRVTGSRIPQRYPAPCA